MNKIEALGKIAARLRIHSLRMTTAAGSGHPTTCLSMADLAACLFFGEMRWNPRDPEDPGNDEFVLSKGHAAPILWAAYAEAGVIPIASLLDLRQDLERPRGPSDPAHEMGQGGDGLARPGPVGRRRAWPLAQRLDGRRPGPSCSWATASAPRARSGKRPTRPPLDAPNNLVAVVDVNRLGQSDPTMHEHDLAAYARKFEAFGWDASSIDGHEIDKILARPGQAGRNAGPLRPSSWPRRSRARACRFIEDKNGWHGKPLKPEELDKALAEIGPPARRRCADASSARRKPWPGRDEVRGVASTSRERPTPRRRPPAWPTARPWQPGRGQRLASWPSTATSRTRPTPTSSSRPFPDGPSSPSSPSRT